jgi:hypothetical protein
MCKSYSTLFLRTSRNVHVSRFSCSHRGHRVNSYQVEYSVQIHDCNWTHEGSSRNSKIRTNSTDPHSPPDATAPPLELLYLVTPSQKGFSATFLLLVACMMDSAPICYIDRLPNEVLRLILSFPSPYDSFAVGGRPYFSTILGARWLSRRFRMIVNDLAFWQNDAVF